MENEGRVRNGGAIAKKKMKIAIAAATAPISGRVSTRANSDFLTGAGASVVFGGCVAGVVAGELMICSRGRGGPGEPAARTAAPAAPETGERRREPADPREVPASAPVVLAV